MKSSNATTSSTCNTNYNNPTLPSSSSSSSSFLNLPQPPPPPPPPPTSSSSSTSFFDPLPSYFPTFHYSPSNPNPNPNPSSSTIPPQQQPPPPPSRPSSSKKRSRASRRAPTTVLTTDTSNFRAMVQEFTGFPAPPFASPSSASSPYSFLSRPFPQKQLPTPSSLVDAIAATAAASGGGGAGAFPMFANPGLIGIHGSVLGPPQPPPPQYGDLGGFVAAAPSEGVQQGHESHVGRSWQDFGGEGGGEDRQEKRQKAGDAVVESWIHSSE